MGLRGLLGLIDPRSVRYDHVPSKAGKTEGTHEVYPIRSKMNQITFMSAMDQAALTRNMRVAQTQGSEGKTAKRIYRTCRCSPSHKPTINVQDCGEYRRLVSRPHLFCGNQCPTHEGTTDRTPSAKRFVDLGRNFRLIVERAFGLDLRIRDIADRDIPGRFLTQLTTDQPKDRIAHL